MKLTPFSLIAMCMAFVHGQGCLDWPMADDGCDPSKYLEKITCSGVAPCKCNIFENPGDCEIVLADDLDSLTSNGLNGASCEQLCLDASDCIFFRWDKDGSTTSASHCTLMSAAQCKGYKRCDKGICLSGQAGCNGGGDNPIPDTAKCTAKVAFVRGSVHWFCWKGDETINIYGNDDVPSGTTCKTAHKCAEFDIAEDDDPKSNYANDFYVECNPEGSPGPGNILWGKYGPSLNDPTVPYGDPGDEAQAMDDDKTSLKDPVCRTTPADLILEADIINEPGVDLVCDNGFTTDATTKKVTVTAPNVCVLLCNFQHAFSFESDLAEDGNGVWNKYDIGSDVPAVLNPDGSEIKCWGFMK